MQNTQSVGIALAVWCCLLGVGSAQDYEVALSRPQKVGDLFGISVEGVETTRSKISANGEIAQDVADKLAIELKGSVRVLEIDKNGEPSKLALTVEKLVKIKGDAQTPLLKTGTEVTAFVQDDKDEFEVEDLPVGKEIQQALAMAIALGHGDATDDDIFGSANPQKVGDTWKVNAEKAAADFSKAGLGIDKEGIEGTATLKEVVTVGDEKCLKIAAQIKMKDFSLPLPPGVVVKTATAEADFSGLFPVNKSVNRLEEHEEWTMNFSAEGAGDPGAPALAVEVTSKRNVTAKYTYTK